MRVYVYYNLHSHKWSIKALEGKDKGLVIAHAKYVKLSQVVPKVSEAGRQRVLRDKQKNVHAGLTGLLEEVGVVDWKKEGYDVKLYIPIVPKEFDSREILTYNPYKYSAFVGKHTEKGLIEAESVMMGENRTVLVINGKFEES